MYFDRHALKDKALPGVAAAALALGSAGAVFAGAPDTAADTDVDPQAATQYTKDKPSEAVPVDRMDTAIGAGREDAVDADDTPERSTRPDQNEAEQ